MYPGVYYGWRKEKYVNRHRHLHAARGTRLPDNDQCNRFEIKSSSSNRVYIVAQHKKNRYWGCSCPGWKSHKHCHHLREMHIPADMKPFEAILHE